MSKWFHQFWKKRYVWITIAGVNSQQFMVSNTMSWTSAAIPKLQSENVNLTASEENNLGNMLLFGSLLGAVISYFLLTYMGRKISLLINQLFSLGSWALLFFKDQLLFLYIGRFLGGVSMSVASLLLPTYEAEAFHPKDRQISGGFMCMYTALGLMLEFTLAPFVSYNFILIINLIPVALFLLLFPLLGKETPYHLIKKGLYEESAEILHFFWHHNSSAEGIKREHENIRETVDRESKLTTIDLFKTIVTDKINLRACVLSSILIIFFAVCGSFQMTMYLESILIQANVTQISASLSSAVIGTVKPIGALLSLPLIMWLGVKLVLIYTLFGSLISLICLGAFFFIQNKGLNTNGIFWLPLASATIFFLCGLMGASVLPFVIRGELLPRHIRGSGGALTDIISSIFSVAANYYYGAFVDRVFIAFWTYAVLTIGDIIFIAFCVPETKDRSLHEIQNALKNKKIIY